MLDFPTGVVAAPWGPIHVAAGPAGVVAVDQLVPEDLFMEWLGRRFGRSARQGSPSVPWPGSATDRARALLVDAVAALMAFVDGDLDALDAIPVDLSDRPAWDVAVLGAVRQLRPGQTASYGEIARRVDRPGAARAVGGAVGRNPVGLFVPCHRVIAGDGTLGGYGAAWFGGPAIGLEVKRQLLAREGVRAAPRGG